MEALAGLGETAVNIPDESPVLGKTNDTTKLSPEKQKQYSDL
jgi:hypothetical protein